MLQSLETIQVHIIKEEKTNKILLDVPKGTGAEVVCLLLFIMHTDSILNFRVPSFVFASNSLCYTLFLLNNTTFNETKRVCKRKRHQY